MYEDIVQDALTEVNRIRADHGLPKLAKLPKGTRADRNGCALYWALRGTDIESVGSTAVTTSDGVRRMAPVAFREFVFKFDAVLIPEYILSDSDVPGVLMYVDNPLTTWTEQVNEDPLAIV